MLTYDVELVELATQRTAAVRGHVESTQLPNFLGGAFGEVMQVVMAQRIAPKGPPYGRFDPVGDGFDAEVGFPVEAEVRPAGRVIASELPGGTAARVMHHGAYADLAKAYDAVSTWLDGHGYVATGHPWESYLDGPEVAEPRTLVLFPCRRAADRGGQ